MISPTGFGSRTLSYSEARRKNLSVPLWSQSLYDLLTSRPSLRYYLKKSFTGDVPEGLIDYAYDTSHQPGARFVPLCFLSGQLFTPEFRSSVYEALNVPVHVLYDRDGYTSFEHLDPYLTNHTDREQPALPARCGMPHWERLTATASALDYFGKSFAVRKRPGH